MIKCDTRETVLSTSEKTKSKFFITHIFIGGKEEEFILLMKVKGRG